MTGKIFFTAWMSLLAMWSFSQVDVVYNDLVWHDEFDGEGAVTSSNWFHQTQLPNGNGWFNGEVQHYTNQTANSYQAGGALHIAAKKGDYTDQGVTKAYTSARLNSKFAFRYGRVDVRAKLPITPGTWPAIWMLGKNVNEDGAYFDATYGTTNWPACGEIDIMERGIFPSQPVNYVQGTIHTPAGHGGSASHGGTMVANPDGEFHVYSMNWSPNEISFLLDGMVYYTYHPTVKTAANWPFDHEQYVLLNVAMGGIAGGIPANFIQDEMQVDYVRIYQNVVADTQAPTEFTASVGTIGHSTVQLLLHANDNSGTVVYRVAYGNQTASFTRPSGTVESVEIADLSPETTYTFTVSAEDLSGNAFSNNPIVLQATTGGFIGCAGTDDQALQGVFTTGYHYAFETIGSDVKITFGLLDDRSDVSAYLWRQTPFGELPMTALSGHVFTRTLTGQTIGSTISYAVKFAYAGGMSVTRYLDYAVGSACGLGLDDPARRPAFSFLNPARELVTVRATSPIEGLEIYDLLGVLVARAVRSDKIAISGLAKGMYWLVVETGGQKSGKKLLVE